MCIMYVNKKRLQIMKKSYLIVLLSTMIFTFAQNVDKKFIGNWIGNLDAGGNNIRIVLKITENNDNFKVLMDSPDQGAKDIPFTDVKINADSINLGLPQAQIKILGKLNDNSTIQCVFVQGTFQAQINFAKTNEEDFLRRPQTPKPPFNYLEEELFIDNKEANVKLAATLTIPKTGSKFPAVILVSGSGPQDRDETIFEHKPFKVIADYLTNNGIAVLRFDDRGVGKSTGSFSEATTLDFASDVNAIYEYLKTDSRIDKNKIGIIGHSEGGIVAPMVAVHNDDVAFIILLAAPGVSSRNILTKQSELLIKANGGTDELVATNNKIQNAIFDIITQYHSESERNEKIIETLNQIIKDFSQDEINNLGLNKDAINAMAGNLSSEWFKFFVSFDPASVLIDVKCPVLALNGSLDLQVEPKENLANIKKIITFGGNKNVTTIEFEGLNHLFQTAKTGTVTEYAQIEETINPKVLGTILNWLKQNIIK